MSDAMTSALVILSTASMLGLLVWADRRHTKAIDRVWREGLPGPRYAARMRGTGLVHLGRPPMTFAEALRYCDTHEGYEVVIRDVVHTPWETYRDRSDRLYREKGWSAAADLGEAADAATRATGVHVARAPDPRPQQIIDDPAGWFEAAWGARRLEVLAEAAGRAKDAGERRLGRPTWAGLFGADPDFTDGKDIDDWLRENRGEA